MIIAGIILLLIAYLLPDLLPSVPPGVLHVCYVLGWVSLTIGAVLFLWGLIAGERRPIGGRRWYY